MLGDHRVGRTGSKACWEGACWVHTSQGLAGPARCMLGAAPGAPTLFVAHLLGRHKRAAASRLYDVIRATPAPDWVPSPFAYSQQAARP